MRLQGAKVLLVEDHKDIGEMLCAVLGHDGAETDCVTTVRDALIAARELRPDVLIAELQMADAAVQLVPEVRKLVGRVPALLISPRARPQDRDQAMAAGADVFLAKPLDPAGLISTVAWLWERSRQTTE